MRKISQAMDKSKFQAFGKVKFKVTPLYRKEIDGLYAKKIKILREENSDEKDKKKLVILTRILLNTLLHNKEPT